LATFSRQVAAVSGAGLPDMVAVEDDMFGRSVKSEVPYPKKGVDDVLLLE
jgi:hypothetical protein